MKLTVAGTLQKTESSTLKFAKGGEVINKSILHKPLPYVAAINLFDGYWISNSETITLGSELLLKLFQSLAVESFIKTPKSVPKYSVSKLSNSFKTTVFAGTFGRVPLILFHELPPSSEK